MNAFRGRHTATRSFIHCAADARRQDRVLKKLAEEAGEVMLASKNDDPGEIVYETADLWFHSLMVLAYHGIPPQAVLDELARRRR